MTWLTAKVKRRDEPIFVPHVWTLRRVRTDLRILREGWHGETCGVLASRFGDGVRPLLGCSDSEIRREGYVRNGFLWDHWAGFVKWRVNASGW